MNIFIVENSGISRECLEYILSDIPDIAVIGHIEANAPGAVDRIATLAPDAVIFDIIPKNMALADMLESIKRCCHGIRVMILVDCTSESDFNRPLHAVENNFFDKASQFMAIRAVLWKWVYDCRLVGSPEVSLP